jgi:hypothetical protein
VQVRASTFLAGHEPNLAIDGNPQTTWRSGTVANDQWMLLDFGDSREYGGLVIDWDGEDYATAYSIETSDDEQNWAVGYHSEQGNGGRDYVYLPEGESRFVRVHMRRSRRDQGYAIAELAVRPFEFSASPNKFFAAIAAESPPGAFPKSFSGKQTYWTVVGVDGDDRESLLSEEGVVEVSKGSFSIEPFLHANGKLITWHDVTTTQGMQEGYLPVPWVEWQDGGLKLKVTAFAGGTADASTLYLRYRVRNSASSARARQLVRRPSPVQVNPPWQSLNMVGGVSAINEIEFDGRTVVVNNQWRVISPHPPVRFGAVSFEGGPLYDFMKRGDVPPDPSLKDPFGFASGALHYDMELPPGAEDEVFLLVPYHGNGKTLPIEGADIREAVDRKQQEVVDVWRRKLGRVEFNLPPAATKLVETTKASIAYTLINRDGPSMQPGSRNYDRSWIRDGAMTSGALLEMGLQPRCVTSSSGSPAIRRRMAGSLAASTGVVPTRFRNDSYGQFIYGVADTIATRAMWASSATCGRVWSGP